MRVLWQKDLSPGAHTSGGAINLPGKVPITEEANRKQLEHLMAAFILACSKGKGISSVAEGDRVLFNVAPKPYLSRNTGRRRCRSILICGPCIPSDAHDNMEV